MSYIEQTANVLDDDAFFSSHLWYALHAFTKFTDQQYRVLNCVGSLLILVYAAILSCLLSLHVHTFCEMFVVC